MFKYIWRLIRSILGYYRVWLNIANRALKISYVWIEDLYLNWSNIEINSKDGNIIFCLIQRLNRDRNAPDGCNMCTKMILEIQHKGSALLGIFQQAFGKKPVAGKLSTAGDFE